MKLNSYLLKASIVGGIGGLLFGFDTAVIAGTTHALTEVFGLSARALGFTVSIALWGTVIGSLSAGLLGQRLGGRNALRIMAVLYLVSALGCALAWDWYSLLFFRFIGGLGIGGSSVLARCISRSWRRRNGVAVWWDFFNSTSSSGILLAYFRTS